jgi:hypothetical protein
MRKTKVLSLIHKYPLDCRRLDLRAMFRIFMTHGDNRDQEIEMEVVLEPCGFSDENLHTRYRSELQ